MNFNAVIDTAAFIWKKELFDKNQTPYYQLADNLVDFVEIFEKEKPQIFLRNDLFNEMIASFPWDITAGISYFVEFKTIVYQFLSKLPDDIAEFNGNIIVGLDSEPNIIYDYYNDNVKQEIAFLLSEIHSNSTLTVYFTFSPIWIEKKQLTTNLKTDKIIHQTVIHSMEKLIDVFKSFKPLFEHNPKHDRIKGRRIENGEEIFPLSCFNNIDNTIPQDLLAKARKGGGVSSKLFSYDMVNDTFVCFQPHSKNKYHGYDVETNSVPMAIQKHFGKYYD